VKHNKTEDTEKFFEVKPNTTEDTEKNQNVLRWNVPENNILWEKTFKMRHNKTEDTENNFLRWNVTKHNTRWKKTSKVKHNKTEDKSRQVFPNLLSYNQNLVWNYQTPYIALLIYYMILPNLARDISLAARYYEYPLWYYLNLENY
jgi:hypothetical protein